MSLATRSTPPSPRPALAGRSLYSRHLSSLCSPHLSLLADLASCLSWHLINYCYHVTITSVLIVTFATIVTPATLAVTTVATASTHLPPPPPTPPPHHHRRHHNRHNHDHHHHGSGLACVETLLLQSCKHPGQTRRRNVVTAALLSRSIVVGFLLPLLSQLLTDGSN